MTYLSISLALTLWLIAVIHFLWGLGFTWPAPDGAALARTVVGSKGVAEMPSFMACTAASLALAIAGGFALSLGGADLLPQWMARLGGALMALVFLGRGIAAYTPHWRRLVPEQPFATLDVALYGPLCLVLGISFVVLVLRP